MSMKSSVVTVSRQAKLARAGAGLALNIAKEEGDPLYDKYSQYREKYITLKEKLIKKYKSKAKKRLGANF